MCKTNNNTIQISNKAIKFLISQQIKIKKILRKSKSRSISNEKKVEETRRTGKEVTKWKVKGDIKIKLTIQKGIMMKWLLLRIRGRKKDIKILTKTMWFCHMTKMSIPWNFQLEDQVQKLKNENNSEI